MAPPSPRKARAGQGIRLADQSLSADGTGRRIMLRLPRSAVNPAADPIPPAGDFLAVGRLSALCGRTPIGYGACLVINLIGMLGPHTQMFLLVSANRMQQRRPPAVAQKCHQGDVRQRRNPTSPMIFSNQTRLGRRCARGHSR